MIDRSLARGLFLCAIALSFGLAALRYPLGRLGNAGPGLFPVLISSLLLLVGITTIVRSRFTAREPLQLKVRNIGLLLTALCAFALISRFVDMVAGIVVMVLIASTAASTFSWQRSAKVAAGLVVIAFGFQKLLGVNLPLL